MTVKKINDMQEYQDALEESKSKLLVIDFSAQW